MERLYSLYLRLYTLDRAGDAPSFTATLRLFFDDAADTDVARVELGAVAAIAVSDFTDMNFSVPIANRLLDFYEFQQVWQRYRNLATRQ
jgi:hypothetical protein